jgi:hypothetical protein
MTTRHELILQGKIQLIHENKDGFGLSQRKLAVGCENEGVEATQ